MYTAAFLKGGQHRMAIEDRNLPVGTRLVASYKKVQYVCTVEAEEGGEGLAFVLEDGSRHKSASAAGSKVMGGGAVNGWRFWSVEGAMPAKAPKPEKPAKPAKVAKTKTGGGSRGPEPEVLEAEAGQERRN